MSCRDVVYLDLALDGAVRSAVESSLGRLRTETHSEEQGDTTSLLVDLVTLCAESVCLTAGSNVELTMIHRDYQVRTPSNTGLWHPYKLGLVGLIAN